MKMHKLETLQHQSQDLQNHILNPSPPPRRKLLPVTPTATCLILFCACPQGQGRFQLGPTWGFGIGLGLIHVRPCLGGPGCPEQVFAATTCRHVCCLCRWERALAANACRAAGSCCIVGDASSHLFTIHFPRAGVYAPLSFSCFFNPVTCFFPLTHFSWVVLRCPRPLHWHAAYKWQDHWRPTIL